MMIHSRGYWNPFVMKCPFRMRYGLFSQAHQSLRCALQIIHGNDQRVSVRGREYSSNAVIEDNNFRNSVKDCFQTCKVPSFDWKKADQRYSKETTTILLPGNVNFFFYHRRNRVRSASPVGCLERCYLGIVTHESDGWWRIVLLPVRYFDQHICFGSAIQLNMDGLQVVSVPPRSAFGADRPKVRRGPQSQNKAANISTRPNESSDYPSCQSSVTCRDFLAFNSNGRKDIGSCEACVDSSNADKRAKKKSRRNRRKGKQNKKVSSDTGSTEPETLSECALGSSTSETCSYNDNGDELVSSATSPGVSLPDGSSNQIDFEGDARFSIPGALKMCTSNIDERSISETFEALNVSSADAHSHQIDYEDDPGFSNSEASTICTSNIDEEAILEAIRPVAQNSPGEHQGIESEVMIGTRGEGFCISDIDVKGTDHVQNRCCDLQSEDFSYVPDSSLVLDYVSVGSNSDNDANQSHLVPSFDKASSREAPCFISRKGVVNAHYHNEGSNHSSESFSSSDMQLFMSGRRGKQTKTMPRSSIAHKYGGLGNSPSRTGKENNHSVWQKVQRNDVDECSSEMSLKEAPSLKRNCNVAEVNTLSKSEEKKLIKDKVSKKLKSKGSPGSKQEHISHGRGYNSNKAGSNAHPKAGKQQNETSDLLPQVNNQNGVKAISRIHSQNSYPRAGFHSSRVEFVNSESVQRLQILPDALKPIQSTSDTVSSIRHWQTESQGSSSMKLCNSLEQNVLKVHPPFYLPHLLFNKVPQTEKDTLAEHCKQNHGYGSVMQKWIPIGVKDPRLTSSARFGNSLMDPSGGPSGENLTLMAGQEKGSCNSQDLVSSLTSGMSQHSGNASFPKEDDQIQKLNNSTVYMLELNKKNSAADNLTSESTDERLSVFEDESINIKQAVKDACRILMESDAIQMATGSPVAEFERVLHFSSPVISQSPSSSCCQGCLQDRFGGGSLCRHETPNIPLRCLWQWYEEHGNYGLEVRAEDHEKSKRLGIDRFLFRSYFVPFLSAVQLFKGRTIQPISNKDEDQSMDSNVGRLPIFSALIPQPRTTSVAQPVDSACSHDAELLFEYFESEQPQLRQALYEKVQELVRSDGSSRYKMYGDPTNLVSLNLHDLHPRSWYSVAWYPIYRIPDGNFRAAFLTYHSLGHFAHRSTKVDPLNTDAGVVSPVVGLQSYNAQSECWFRLRQNANQTEGTPSLDPSRILKERLRTLEKTASLMARAVVKKGNQTSVNRHPDFEFFLSRRGYFLRK